VRRGGKGRIESKIRGWEDPKKTKHTLGEFSEEREGINDKKNQLIIRSLLSCTRMGPNRSREGYVKGHQGEIAKGEYKRSRQQR